MMLSMLLPRWSTSARPANGAVAGTPCPPDPSWPNGSPRPCERAAGKSRRRPRNRPTPSSSSDSLPPGLRPGRPGPLRRRGPGRELAAHQLSAHADAGTARRRAVAPALPRSRGRGPVRMGRRCRRRAGDGHGQWTRRPARGLPGAGLRPGLCRRVAQRHPPVLLDGLPEPGQGRRSSGSARRRPRARTTTLSTARRVRAGLSPSRGSPSRVAAPKDRVSHCLVQGAIGNTIRTG